LPPTQSVTFKARLQEGNRIQIPKLVRHRYKLEPQQILVASVATFPSFSWEEFHTRMTRDGHIVIPRLTLQLLEGADGSLVGRVLEIQLKPIKQ
jgi:bifunctional DNA-binding transcriptional regulator/antitoxin component of YhaV-PrlF toxin-antitoxin module